MSFSTECSCRCFGIIPENSAKVKIRIEELLKEGAEQKYLHLKLAEKKNFLCRFRVLVNEGLCEKIALVFHSEYAAAEAAVIAVHDGKIEYWVRQFDADFSGYISQTGKELVVFEDTESTSQKERSDQILASFDSPERDREGWIRL